jgi:diacylglycerol O-acyltransferase / wax synthase
LRARATARARLFNLTITNVPGPTRPLYAFGAKLDDVLPLVPLAADHAVGIAVVSYDGKVFFGLSGDARALPDLEVLRTGIEDSITELKALARRAGRAGRVAAVPR